MNSVLYEDIQSLCDSPLIDWEAFRHANIMITGSTGSIGHVLVQALDEQNKNGLDAHLILPVRSIEKARGLFGDMEATYIETDVEHLTYDGDVDYILHAASPTKSRFFIEKPVETINTAVLGTLNVLNIARDKKVKSMVYLSSMEMYGVLDKSDVTEEELGYINPLNVRSSYSEAKRVCEMYCYCYMSEYGVNVKIARVAMTFGAGLLKTENRVYKYFCDSVLHHENIVIKSTGTTVVNYSYLTDTISGILFLMLKGVNGEAYNLVADPTNMSVYDSAKWLADTFGDGQVEVVIDIPKENTGFAPDNTMVLSNKKLRDLGWQPQYDLKEGYARLYAYLKEEEKS